jgi:hypothetical protein
MYPNPCRHLIQLRTDGTGKSALTRLPSGRWWQVLGSTTGGAYQVFLSWGNTTAQFDNVATGFHSDAFVAFPDAFVSITGQPNATFFVAVSE